MTQALLNIGCGTTFHADWVNLDATPASPEVRAHDLADPLPFADGHFQGVYASHVLEHFPPDEGLRLLRECLRVLRPGGVVRIVVPDLEAIARAYLEALDAAEKGEPAGESRYDWMTLELYDQTVRTASGGRMGAYLAGPLDDSQRRFVTARIGDDAIAGATAAGGARLPRRWRLASLLLGAKRAATLREAAFRRTGELHQWMYDRFSLPRALSKAGFREARRRAADESAIADFARYGLETIAGRPRKPDSLYVEARRP